MIQELHNMWRYSFTMTTDIYTKNKVKIIYEEIDLITININ